MPGLADESAVLKPTKSRCIHCRSDIAVPATYAQGDFIKCGTCGTQHKVMRGEGVRLVLADVTPLKEALRSNNMMIERLEDELQGARRSFGIGVNGLGIGVAYAIYLVAFQEHTLDMELATKAIAAMVGSGIFLELLNYFFLAKRQRVKKLSAELEEARQISDELEQKIRESSRA
jgi:predicted RNase H-like nuclease (RuvC/YqgF family)